MAGTPFFDYQAIIDRYYPEGTLLRDIYMRHSEQVAELALEVAERKALPLDKAQIRAAAMLHDIGIYLCSAPGIECHGSEPYIAHGPLGAALLRREGAPEWAIRVAERHTGAGLDGYQPETLLEQLICYADKFYSKSGTGERKSPDAVARSLARFGAESAARWAALVALFT